MIASAKGLDGAKTDSKLLVMFDKKGYRLTQNYFSSSILELFKGREKTKDKWNDNASTERFITKST